MAGSLVGKVELENWMAQGQSWNRAQDNIESAMVRGRQTRMTLKAPGLFSPPAIPALLAERENLSLGGSPDLEELSSDSDEGDFHGTGATKTTEDDTIHSRKILCPETTKSLEDVKHWLIRKLDADDTDKLLFAWCETWAADVDKAETYDGSRRNDAWLSATPWFILTFSLLPCFDGSAVSCKKAGSEVVFGIQGQAGGILQACRILPGLDRESGYKRVALIDPS
ncbi:hypothetical protein NUW58_g10602 [Xylaria curta]|uniref:Uncharacterized protein n=1 Tax=Xylaria curta TaxID=42375 RepID=A0ACC1MI58_9PEZI|nr:hypothetical protein NUW58_g10602 [Xylaria curta]